MYRCCDVHLCRDVSSVNEVTARVLRFCSLLPAHHLTISPEALDTVRPIFTNPSRTRIASPEYTELLFVCKYVDAYRGGKFRPGDSFDPSWVCCSFCVRMCVCVCGIVLL